MSAIPSHTELSLSQVGLLELDSVTPVYQLRMRQLSTTQARVVAAMAYIGDGAGCFARDIAERARLGTSSVSATLARLEQRTWPDVFAPEDHGLSLLEMIESMPRFAWVERGARSGRAVRYRLVDQRLSLWLRVRKSPTRAACLASGGRLHDLRALGSVRATPALPQFG